MDQRNIVYVDHRKVKCEDLSHGIGHPLIYLEIKESQITCPYCSKIFKLKSENHES